MTLNQLGYFLPGSRVTTLQSGCRKMNISEPSLSRSISSLEDELGVTLLKKEAET